MAVGAAAQLLTPGDRIAILNAANLGSGALTDAFIFTAPPNGQVTLMVLNLTSVTLTLEASGDNITWQPVTVGGSSVTIATDTCLPVTLGGGLFYALKAGGAVTAGTIWVSR